MINNASKFVAAGIAIIPIRYKDKRPEFSLLPLDQDNKPTWEPFKTILPNTEQLSQWFAKPINYGVVCGWSGLTVLDFDQIGEYNKWLLWASQTGGVSQYVANHAYRVSTARGVHVYIRLPYKERNKKLPGIDIKGNGYVLGPGSIHPTGVIYTAMRDVFNMPLIQALSDILPVELLLQDTEHDVTSNAAQTQNQVWQSRAASGTPGKSLVKKVTDSYRIEDFFPMAKQTGKSWYVTQCPLHDDHNPSFWINTEQQICGCFAGCNGDKPMDVVNLYARLHGLSNHDAIFAMANKLS